MQSFALRGKCLMQQFKCHLACLHPNLGVLQGKSQLCFPGQLPVSVNSGRQQPVTQGLRSLPTHMADPDSPRLLASAWPSLGCCVESYLCLSLSQN